MPTEFEVQSVTTGVRAGRLRKSWGEELFVRGRRQPPSLCPSISLLCNSISASKSKCGWVEFAGHISTPPKRYCHSTFQNDSYKDGSLCCASTEELDWGFGDASCLSCGNSNSITSNTCPGTCGAHCVESCTPTLFSSTSTVAVYKCHNSSFNCDFTQTVTRSVEYTTDQLKTDAAGELPSYADCFACDGSSEGCSPLITGQGCTCSAFRNLSADETSYTIRRFKYKFHLAATPPAYLKILWNETFKPTLSADVDYCGTHYDAGQEDPDPSHWTKTARTYTWSGTGHDSSEFTVNEPSTNGTIYITDIRWATTSGHDPAPSSIEGVDQFAGSSTSYLCNSRTAADRNCPTG